MENSNKNRIRVLFIESIVDDDVKERHDILNNSPRFSDYIFKFFSASPFVWLKDNSNELLNELRKKIDIFRPDIVFMHTGMAWRDNPQLLSDTFCQLKTVYPDLKFAIENSVEYAKGDRLFIYSTGEIKWSVFDQDDEVIKLEKLLTFRNLE